MLIFKTMKHQTLQYLHSKEYFTSWLLNDYSPNFLYSLYVYLNELLEYLIYTSSKFKCYYLSISSQKVSCFFLCQFKNQFLPFPFLSFFRLTKLFKVLPTPLLTISFLSSFIMLYFLFLFSSYSSFSFSIISCYILKKKKSVFIHFLSLGYPLFTVFVFQHSTFHTRAFFFFAVRFNPLSFLHGILCNLYRFSLYLTLFFFFSMLLRIFTLYTLFPTYFLFTIFAIEEFVGETIFTIS